MAWLREPEKCLRWNLRTRKTEPGREAEILHREAVWAAENTAVLICDMWDRHWCAGASRRVDELAPAMNHVLRAAR